MIYNQSNFKSGALKQVVPVSAALSWSKMEAPLTNAEKDYLLPAVGQSVLDKLQSIAESEESGRTDFERQILYYAMTAVGNLAFYSNFDALNVRITDQGFQRSSSENGTYQPAYKYQEDNLRNDFRNKGYNAIDHLLDFLDYAVDGHDDQVKAIGALYAETDAYKAIRKSIVRNAREVQNVYDINHSYILFLTLNAKMATIEELTLEPILGPTLYKALKLWLEENITKPSERHYHVGTEVKDDEFFEELRLRCGRVMIMKAVESLLRTTGTVTDRGQYFKSDTTSSSYAVAQQPVTDTRLNLLLNDASRASDGYINSLTIFVNSNMTTEENKIANPSRALDRDNDGKAAFFA